MGTKAYHFVVFKPLSYCFEERIEFQIGMANRPPIARLLMSLLIKQGDITKEF